MSKLELNQIYLQLEREIMHSGQFTTSCLRNSIKNDAFELILEIKTNIDNWAILLKERKMTCSELENLLAKKCMENKYIDLVSKYSRIDVVDASNNILLEIIAKAIVNTHFNALYGYKSPISKLQKFENMWY